MLDQIFGRLSSSQWIVFLILMILLVGLSELAGRIATKRNHVPGAVWLLLLCVTGCGLWLVSYQAGTSGRPAILERYVFPLLVAIVVALITDIDSPRRGLISLDEPPLLESNETLTRASATTTP